MRILIAVFTAVLLTGCASQQARMDHDATVGICSSIYQSDGFALLREQVPNNALEPSVAQLADTRKPTQEQAQVIAKVTEIFRPCHDATSNYMATHAPAALPYYTGLRAETNRLWAKLMIGEITFGEFNAARAGAASNANQQAAQAESTRVAQRNQMLMQQQQLLMQQQQNMNIIRQQTQPRTVNCHTYGAYTNCSQY